MREIEENSVPMDEPSRVRNPSSIVFRTTLRFASEIRRLNILYSVFVGESLGRLRALPGIFDSDLEKACTKF